MSRYAPIALFCYCRPDHLGRTLEALRACPEAAGTDLVVFSDGPKNEAARAGVEAVRALLKTTAGFRSLRVVAKETNAGLANSIIAGVTEMVAAHGRVIVVEDDLVVSPHFLAYMNQGLDMYADDEAVASIHGYSYPTTRPLPETFFIRGADCWGWATWDRAWRHFRADGAALLKDLEARDLCHAFDFDGTYGFTSMLRGQIEGRNNSWAIRWHAATYLDNMVTLYPGRPLVQNIGHDGSGTHCGANDTWAVKLTESPLQMLRLPAVESPQGREVFKRYFMETHPISLRKKIKRWIKDRVKAAIASLRRPSAP